MIRVAANCDIVPTEVAGIVRKVQETSGRHIRRVRINDSRAEI